MSIRELPPDLAKIAKSINEDPKRTPADIEAIKQWLKKQPHLNARYDDQWILTFLRGCKFSLERTKEKLDTYYTFKTLLPEFFENRDPLRPVLHEILKLGATLMLPKPDKMGRHIMMIKIGINDPKKYNALDMMVMNYVQMDTMLLELDRTVIAGGIVILDFKNVTMEHMTQMSPSMIKKSMQCYQEAYPIRPQAVHYINTNSVFESMFHIFKTFMSKKLQGRLHVHGTDLNKLYAHVPRDLLPSDYGGELPSSQELAATWMETVISHRQWFLDDAKYKSDEKRRPGKPKTTSDVFGLEGSFRALQVD